MKQTKSSTCPRFFFSPNFFSSLRLFSFRCFIQQVIIIRVHFQVQVVEQDFKSLYLGSHDLTSSGGGNGVATSSSKSLESVAEVHADEEMLSKLGPSSSTSIQSSLSLLIVLLPFLLVLLKIPGGL